MLWLYSSIIWLIFNAIKYFPFKNKKTTLFISGRHNWQAKLLAWKQKKSNRPVIWMHVASLGEYYQGIPVFERIHQEYKEKYTYLITFFSPSGYEVIKKKESFYSTFYLPIDTKYNANQFLNIVFPHLVLLIKYEFWPNILFQIKRKNITCVLIAALFRKSQPFFQWYGAIFKTMLHTFTRLYVQNQSSHQLLSTIGFKSEIYGDPRIDDTLKRQDGVQDNASIKNFKDGKNIIVIGSCWHEDLDVILASLVEFLKNNDAWKIIIAPHDYSNNYGSRISKAFEGLDGGCVKYSKLDENSPISRILIIDTVGVLFSSYQYGDIAIIGGGFGVGLHNIMEPSVFRLPIIFGNKSYNKFQEAIDLVELKSAFLISNTKECMDTISKLASEKIYRQDCGDKNYNYMLTSQGASQKILEDIKDILH